jgi:tetratricopeptide (TPR) repeat protein
MKGELRRILMKCKDGRSTLKTFINFVCCFILIALCGVNAESKEALKFPEPTITQYPHVQMEILYTNTYRIEDIIDCEFYDPTKDSAFMQHLERDIVDTAFRKTIVDNHYGTVISFSSQDHPSGSDTVFYPSKDRTICKALKKAKVISINNIQCIGDHYPPCWLGIGGLVKKVCTKQNLASCGEVTKYDPAVEESEMYITLGQESLKEGEFDQAISDFSQAIEANPKYYKAFNSRGIAYYRKGQYDLAIADYSRAIKLYPKDSMIYLNRGISYAYTRQNNKAINDFNKAIQLNKDNFDAYYFRGIVYKNKGQLDSALSDFNRAITIIPNNIWAYINRGLTYVGKGKYDKAIADYNKAIEINPGASLVYNNRGFAYSNKGQYDKAISDYNKALEIDPKNVYAYSNLGDAYFKLNNQERSCVNYQKACDLGFCGGLEKAKKEGRCK